MSQWMIYWMDDYYQQFIKICSFLGILYIKEIWATYLSKNQLITPMMIDFRDIEIILFLKITSLEILEILHTMDRRIFAKYYFGHR